MSLGPEWKEAAKEKTWVAKTAKERTLENRNTEESLFFFTSRWGEGRVVQFKLVVFISPLTSAESLK